MADFHPEYRCEQKVPATLTIEEALAMIQSVNARTSHGRRDRVILMLLYGCGLRTGEVCGLKIQDIDIEKQMLHIRQAKGDIERYVPIPEVVFTELLAYLLQRDGKRGALFLTAAKRRPIRILTVSRVVKNAAVDAGITRSVTPKMLRHSFATHLMDRGVDIAIISKLMGHSGPSETGVYLHVLEGRVESAVKRLEVNPDKETEQC